MYGFSFVKTLPLQFARFVRDYHWVVGKEIEVVEGADSCSLLNLFDMPVEIQTSRQARRLDSQKTPCVIFSFVGRQRRPSTFECYEDILTISALVLSSGGNDYEDSNHIDILVDLLESFFLSLVDERVGTLEYKPHSVNISEWDLSVEPLISRNLLAAGLIVEIMFASSRTGHILD